MIKIGLLLKTVNDLIVKLLNDKVRSKFIHIIVFLTFIIPVFEFIIRLVIVDDFGELLISFFKIMIGALVGSLILVVDQLLFREIDKLIDSFEFSFKELEELKEQIRLERERLEKELKKIKE